MIIVMMMSISMKRVMKLIMVVIKMVMMISSIMKLIILGYFSANFSI